MTCPKCGSHDIEVVPVTTQTTRGKMKGFGWIKACLGWLIFSVPGILCGLCGMGKGKTRTTHTTRLERTCRNCGKRF